MKLSKLLFFILIIVFTFNVCSKSGIVSIESMTGSINGTITIDGYGAEGFTVIVLGTSFMAVTCEDGIFWINNLPEGSYRLGITSVNFTLFFNETVDVIGGRETHLTSKDISGFFFIRAESVELDVNEIIMAIGENMTLNATVIPKYATIKDLIWVSSKPDIVSVDMLTNKITANAEGTAVITVSTVDSSKTAVCTVKVMQYVSSGPVESSVLILQAGASGTDGAINRSFVELYNTTNSPIDLGTFSLQYAAGTSSSTGQGGIWLRNEVQPWQVINLVGTIPAGGSFLIAGEITSSAGRLQIETADQIIPDFRLSNRSFQVALLSNKILLSVTNPFNAGGAPVAGFMDLLGAINTAGTDGVDAYETAPAEIISQQASARRNSLIDTNNNTSDFVRIDYRIRQGSNGITDEVFEKVKPRKSTDGTWEPQF